MYTNTQGRHLRVGHFLRSAALVGLKKKDHDFLGTYPLFHILDLRTVTEKSEGPDEYPGIIHHVSILSEAKAGISHEKSNEEKLKMIPDMIQLYTEFIEDDQCVEKIREALEVICSMSEEDTILWHCTEGKDRCGIISALFLKLMGFSDEVIMEDYLTSLKSAVKRARKYYLLVALMSRDLKAAAAIRDVFLVKREYLTAFFQVIEKKYGSAEQFLASIGFDDERIRVLQDRYLVG